MGNRTIGISFQLYSRNITRHKALHVSSMFNYKHANQNKPFSFGTSREADHAFMKQVVNKVHLHII